MTTHRDRFSKERCDETPRRVGCCQSPQGQNSLTNMTEYSIVLCNLNMAKTIERSLRSILDQVGMKYEVIVVDGGSTDGSLQILRRLSVEYDRLRVVCTTETAATTLGADRNIGVKIADGNHVLVQLDADDEFDPVIDDFVAIYEELRTHREADFFLSGHGINIAPRALLLSYGPYRPQIDRREDADLWRRLLANEEFVQLDHRPVCRSIGYEPDTKTFLRQRVSEIRGDLLSGVTACSRARQTACDRSVKVALAELLLLPVALLTLRGQERYELPSPYERAQRLERGIEESTRTLAELKQEFPSFSVTLSERGRGVFE